MKLIKIYPSFSGLHKIIKSFSAQRILLLGRLEMFQADYSCALSTILSRSFLNLFTSLLRPLRTNMDELSAGEKLKDIAVSRAEPDLESALTQILSGTFFFFLFSTNLAKILEIEGKFSILEVSNTGVLCLRTFRVTWNVGISIVQISYTPMYF